MATTGAKLGCASAALGAVVVLGLVVVSIGRSVVTDAAPPQAASANASAIPIDPDAPADVVALLDKLRPGEKVGDFTVGRISVQPDKHSIRIELAQDSDGFSVWIERKSTTPAPRQTGKYSVFFGATWETRGAKLTPGFEGPVLDAITERLRKTEADVPVPKGL